MCKLQFCLYCADDPQSILEPPVVIQLSDTNATISWTEATGDVEGYIIQYTHILEGRVLNVIVNGTNTSFTLTGLEPTSDYVLVIFTVNSNGQSPASPTITFTTLGKTTF